MSKTHYNSEKDWEELAAQADRRLMIFRQRHKVLKYKYEQVKNAKTLNTYDSNLCIETIMRMDHFESIVLKIAKMAVEGMKSAIFKNPRTRKITLLDVFQPSNGIDLLGEHESSWLICNNCHNEGTVNMLEEINKIIIKHGLTIVDNSFYATQREAQKKLSSCGAYHFEVLLNHRQ